MPKSSIDILTNLNFPSSQVKKFLKTEIQIKNYKVGENYISIGNSQHVLTKSIESLIYCIIDESIIYLTKSNMGLYELKFKDISSAIYQNEELKENFLSLLLKYNKDLHYSVVNNKDLSLFIDNINKNIKINNDVINFIQYLINYYCCSFLKYSYIIMINFHRTRINSMIIKICWSILFVGKFHDRLFKELEDTIKSITDYKEKEAKEKESKDKKEEPKEKEEVKKEDA